MPQHNSLCPNCFAHKQIERPCRVCCYYGDWGVSMYFAPPSSVMPPIGFQADVVAAQNVEQMLSFAELPRESIH